VLIGITGKAFSGKDTCASEIIRLLERDGKPAYNAKFADPLKDMICAMLGCTRQTLEDPVFKESKLKELGVTPRHLMQTLGVDWARKCIRPEVWCDLFDMRWGYRVARGERVVVSDVRFDNEAKLIRKMGGFIVQVVRQSDTTESSGHESEHGIDPALVHVVLHNDTTPARLGLNALAAYATWASRKDK